MKGYELEKQQEERKSRNPDEPWLWREDWAAGLIKDSNLSLFPVWFFAVFWNLISMPYAFFVLPILILENRYYSALGLLIFPLVGTGLLIWAIRTTLRRDKFGTSVLKLETLPGVIGGHLKAVIRIPTALLLEEGPVLMLTCIKQTHSGEDTNEEILWQEVQVIPKDRIKTDWRGSSIPFTFDIPYQVKETDREDMDMDNAILWYVEASASVPVVDYRAQFEVPVFRTQESDPEFVPGREAEAPQAATSLPGVDYEAPFQAPFLRTQKSNPELVPARVSEAPQQVVEELPPRGGHEGIDVRPAAGVEPSFTSLRRARWALPPS